MIEIKNVNYSYPGSHQQVFSQLSLNIEGNAIYGLLGKNGMGKTTMLYLIAGLLSTKEGEVTVDGIPSHQRNSEMLRQMYIVTEDFDLPEMLLSEYVKVSTPFCPNFSEEVMNRCLSEFEMQGDPMLNTLSMGQKKKVYISFALATCTRYLIMDEPTNGLDIPSKAQFRKILAGVMTDDRTIIISTHQVHDVDTLLDHVIILDNSNILLNASVDEICEKYVFEYRTPDQVDDAIYAEPTLQGNAVMALRAGKPETPLNLELLFNATVTKK